ncbi:MAG: hypothetical protein K6G16_10360, partial [Lachnospiraceae bacterium]|nr:hypothetical protein [Lachnospiraceae bacterium]
MTIRSLLSRCRPRFSRRVWITLGIAALCFLVSWIFFVIRTGMASRLHDQRAAFTWSENGTGASQLTVFFP